MSPVEISKKEISRKQCAESGQALALLLLLIWLLRKEEAWGVAAFVALLLSMLIPMAYYPFAIVWFALSRTLQRLSTTFLLSLVFILVVVPMGLWRRTLGKDPMKCKAFGEKGTMLVRRGHRYVPGDLEHTF